MSTRGMKTLGIAVLAVALAIAVYASTAPGRPSTDTRSAAPASPQVVSDQSAELAARVDQLQQSVAALAAELAAQRNTRAPAQVASASGDAKPPELKSVEEQRAADAERLRNYMV